MFKNKVYVILLDTKSVMAMLRDEHLDPRFEHEEI